MASVNDVIPVHLDYSPVDTMPVETVSLTPQPAKTPSRKFGKDISNNASGRKKTSSGKKVVRLRKGVASAKKQKKSSKGNHNAGRTTSTSNTSSLMMEEAEEEEAVSTITYQTQETESRTGRSNTTTKDLKYHVQFESGPIGLKLEPVVESMGKEMGCRIMKFVDGGPQRPGQARKSGKIQLGDLLIAIEGVDVSSWEYRDIIERLKWPSKGRCLSFRSVWVSNESSSSKNEKTQSLSGSSNDMTSTETRNSSEETLSGGGSSTEKVIASQILNSFEPDQTVQSTNNNNEAEDASSADLSTVTLSEYRESASPRVPPLPQHTQELSELSNKENTTIVAAPGRPTSTMLRAVVKDVALPVAGVVASSSLSLTASVTSAMSTKLGEVLVGHSNREFDNVVQLKTKLLTELSHAKAALNVSHEVQKRLQREIQEISKEKEAERDAKEKLERELSAARDHQVVIENQISDMENQMKALSGSLDEERLQTKATRDELVSQVEDLERQKQQLEVSFEKEKASLIARETAASERENQTQSQLEETKERLEVKVKEMLARMEEMDSSFEARNTELESCVKALRDKLQQKIEELDSTKAHVKQLLTKQENLTTQAVEFDSIVQDAQKEKGEVATELEQARIELDRARGQLNAAQNQVDETMVTLESTLNEKETEIDNLTDELNSRDAAVEMLRTILNEKDAVLDKTMAAVETARSEEETLVHKIEELEVIVNEANAEKTFLNHQLTNSQEELSAALNRVSHLEEQLSQMNEENESDFNEVVDELASTEAALELAKDDLLSKNERIEELEKLTNDKDSALADAKANYDDLQLKMKEFSIKMADQSEEKILNERNELSMVYSQERDEMNLVLSQKDSQIQNLKEEVVSKEKLLTDTKNDLQSKISKIEHLDNLMNEKEETLSIANKNSDDLRTKMEELTVTMTTQNEENIQIETDRLDMFYLQELDKLNTCVSDKYSHIQNLEQELVSKNAFLEDSENDAQRKNEMIDKLEKVMNEKDEALAAATQKSEDLQTQMEQLKIDLMSLSEEKIQEEGDMLNSFYSQELDKMKSHITQKDSYIQNLERALQLSDEEVNAVNSRLQKIDQNHLEELRRVENEKEESLSDLQAFGEEAASTILKEKEQEICSLEKQLAIYTSSDSKLRKRLNDVGKIHSTEVCKLEHQLALATQEKESMARANAELERHLKEAESSSEKKEFARISIALREAEDLVSKLNSDFDSEEVNLSAVTNKQSNLSERGTQETSETNIDILKSSFLGKQLAQAESRAKDARAEAAQRFRRVKSLEADLDGMSREFELLVKTNELMEERLRSTRSSQLAAEEDLESLEEELAENKRTQEKLQVELKHEMSEKLSLSSQLSDFKLRIDHMAETGKEREQKYEASISKLHQRLLESESNLSDAQNTQSDLVNETNSLKVALEDKEMQITRLEATMTGLQGNVDNSQLEYDTLEKEFTTKLSALQEELVSVKENLNSTQNLLAACEGERKLMQGTLQAKETEKAYLEKEIESQRSRIEKVESSRDDAVSRLTAACQVVDEQKEAIRLAEEKINKLDKNAERHREQTAKSEQRIAELEEAALEQEQTIREEIEKARELLEKETIDASVLANELEEQLAQAALKIEGMEEENVALCSKIVEWEKTCQHAKKCEAEAMHSCALHTEEIKKLENKLDERKNEADRLIAHAQVLGSTVSRLRSELLMKETEHKRLPKDIGRNNVEELVPKTSSEDPKILSNIVSDEDTKQAMKVAGAKMMCRLIEKKNMANEVSLLGSSYRHWMCTATTDHAVAYHVQVAGAMAQQLETTREKLAVLKTHLKHAHNAERKNQMASKRVGL